MNLNDTGHKQLLEFQEAIYHLLNIHNEEMIADGDIDLGTGINIQAAVLLKTAIELYTIHFSKDEPIHKILDVAKSTLQHVRVRTELETASQTYH